MAVFTITVTASSGVDLSLFFPGLLATQWSGSGYNPTSGYTFFQSVNNDIVDASKYYTIDTLGKNYSFPSGDGGVAGTITSATLSVTPMGGAKAELANLSIALGTGVTALGGIPIPSMMDMTPDSIMRLAARLDPDGAKLILKGGDGNDTLPGSHSGDVLDGGRGIDRLVGSGGDDLYYVDNQYDAVIENSGEGLDTVIATVSYRLAMEASVESLRAFGSAGRVGLTGNSFANQIFGNESANRLDGGAGNDTLTGGLGKDAFLFTTKLSKTGNVDQILDFKVVDDSIWLENGIFKALDRNGSLSHPAKLKADAFYVGNHAHDTSDRIIYSKTTGALYYDPDGTGHSSQIKFAQLATGLKMTASDFFAI
jgi:Ca2+-binding RTX toxin-like protein